MLRFVRYFIFAIAAWGLAGLPRHAGAVLLTDNGEAKAVIVTADAANAATLDAVAELNYWLEKISGTALPVQTFAEWDGQGTFVAVGSSPLTQGKGWDSEPFAQEEARVFITDEGIGLLGNDNATYPGVQWTGTYYAVLEFLQKELGARWIWPGPTGEVYEKQTRLDPQPRQWTWAPDLTLMRTMRHGYSFGRGGLARPSLRDLKANFDIVPDAADWDRIEKAHDLWLKRERMNLSSSAKFGHAFVKWWQRYAQSHPDWFSRPPEGLTQHGGRGVKLNLSNPEVADKIFDEWHKAWKKNPAANRFLNVGPNDSRGFDTRPETRAMDAPQMQSLTDKEIYNGSEAVLTDRYVRFWNGLAKRVKEVDPQAQVTTYAYRNYRKPPLEDSLMLEPNIVIAYVGGEGYYPDEPFIRSEWKGWSDHGAQMFWRPNILQPGHGIPYSFARALYDDFAFLRAQGNMLGTDIDSLIGNWSGQGLVYYVLGEQHSRPEATYEELSNEYFSAFGPAEDSIRKFYEYFEKRTWEAPEMLREPGVVPRMTWGGWWIGHMRIVSEFLTPEVIAEGNKLLEQAQAQVAGAQPIYRERVDMVVRGFTHAELMANAFRELNVNDPQVRINPKQARKVLQPLWDFRMKHMTDIAVPVARYFALEQRNMQLWNAFRGEGSRPAARVHTYPLTEGWRLRADAANEGIAAHWYEKDVAGEQTGWLPASVDKPWRRAVPALPQTEIAWYRLVFEVPELADTGELVRLRFGSVDAETQLWINGVKVDERGYPHMGNYDSWAEAFDVDITSAVRGGAQNILIMRVESERPNGGITGPVSLVIGN